MTIADRRVPLDPTFGTEFEIAMAPAPKTAYYLDVHYPRSSASQKRDARIARRLGLRDYRRLTAGLLRFSYPSKERAQSARKLVCRVFHDVTAGVHSARS